MHAPTIRVHDVTRFPIVRFEPEAAEHGYATQWCREMDSLVAGGRPFVLVYPARRKEEAHEDRVLRGAWLKRNKAALEGRCLGLIVIEPDAARRAELEAMFPNLIRAFGTPQAARANAAEAEALARHILAGNPIPETNLS